MIKTLRLKNYRCYDDHSIEFKSTSIAVGKNNAGKSTFIEGLRIASLVTNRYKNLTYKLPPPWLDLGRAISGVSPSLKGIEFSFRNIYHQYGEPPAEIEITFHSDAKIRIYFGGDQEIFAVIFDEEGKVIRNKGQANSYNLPEINILPQIGTLREKEGLLEPNYVRSNVYSNLASSHFRNQLQYFKEHFLEFTQLAESTWKNLRVRDFIHGDRITNEEPSLMIQDEGFVAEIGWMGHGLQMWLQTMWFIARCNIQSTVILDEPDVYLHADLQRKLIRFIKSRFDQIIIATHSVEIISEVNPDDILIINKNKPKSKYATNLPAVQEIITGIGSVHNLELIRFWSASKFLIFEGDSDDVKILKIFQDKLFPDSEYPLDTLPKTFVEGWGGWQRVVGAQSVFTDEKMKVFCVFDSDYHLEEDKEDRYEKAKGLKINLHIWRWKEIENYLLDLNAIFRIIERRKRKGNPQFSDLKEKVNDLLEEFKEVVIDSYATELQLKNKGWTASKFNNKARELVNSNWSDFEKKLGIVPGKDFVKALSDWAQQEYGVSFSKFQIASEIKKEEIDPEIRDVVGAIEFGVDFGYRLR